MIDKDLLLNAAFEILAPEFYYSSSSEDDLKIKFDFVSDTLESEYVLNEASSNWLPIENNLVISQRFKAKKPTELFGEIGVTHPNNTLGVACFMYSKTSNFRKTIHITDIDNYMDELDFVFEHEFNPGTLGGTIFFEIYIYLKKVNIEESYKANNIGTILTEVPLSKFAVIVDGSGSEFPIVEINDTSKPLWNIKTTWTDIYHDLFDASSVRLILNQGHAVFNTLMNQKTNISQYLMNDIIINAMALVVQEAILIQKNEINENIDYESGTVAQVVWYWISTFEVDLTSLETIQNSIREKADYYIKERS